MKYFVSIVCLTLTITLRAQTPLPAPIKGVSPALLPDSSIMVSSFTSEGVVRYVHENGEWSTSPDELTKQINTLTIGDDSNLHFRFSNDYNRIVVRRDQPEGYSFFENVRINGEWEYFKEILLDNPPNTYSMPSFSMDNNKLYILNPDKKSWNKFLVFNDDNAYESSEEYLFDEMEGLNDIIALGNNSVLIHARKKKQKEFYFFFSKQLTSGQWTAPQALFKVKANPEYTGFATTGFDDLLIYTDITDSEVVYLMESPAVVREELQKARRGIQPNTKSQEIVDNVERTVSRTETSDSEFAAFGDVEIAQQIGDEMRKVKNFALLIGVNEYIDPNVNDLDNPIADAELLRSTLISQYTFEPGNVRLLKNPGRSDIIEALDRLVREVQPQDNLLIFYAGHGLWDERLKTGFWLPADAAEGSRANWFSNSELVGYVAGIRSKHTLLIADACFSGGIFKTRDAFTGVTSATFELFKLPSRKAMTSGTMNTVPDKSVFIEYLVKRLKENSKPFLTSEDLFRSFRKAVINNSPNQQVPQFGEIRETGDEGGDFIFIKK